MFETPEPESETLIMLSTCSSKPAVRGSLLTVMTQPVSTRREIPRIPVPATKLTGRVLVAEDNLSQQRILCFMLKRMNVEVTVAADGRTACEMAEESQLARRPYDLILMDIHMPQRDGYEATRYLRQQGWQGPIVALTACDLLGDREACLNAGCDAHLAKPFSVAELQEILLRFLILAPNRSEC